MQSHLHFKAPEVAPRVRWLVIGLTAALGIYVGVSLDSFARSDEPKSLKQLVWELERQEGLRDQIWQATWNKLPQIARRIFSRLTPAPARLTRAAAAHQLLQLAPEDPDVIDALVRAVTDPDPEVRQWAIEALRAIGPAASVAIPVLIREYNTPTCIHRDRIAYALGSIAPDAPAVIETLKKAASAKETPGTRGQIAPVAVRVLADISNPTNEIAPFLLKTLEESDGFVAVQIVRVLPRVRGYREEIVGTLGRLLEAEKSAIQYVWVVTALRDIGPGAAAAAPQLTRLYGEVRKLQSPLQMRQPPTPRGPGGRTAADDVIISSPRTTYPATGAPGFGLSLDLICQALARMGPAARDALPLLEKDWRDPDHPFRYSAAIAAWQIGGPNDDLVSVVRGALKEPEPSVRRVTVERLRDVGASAVPLLLEAFKDLDRRVRRAALISIAEVEKDIPNLVGILEKGLSDPEMTVRVTAIRLLAALGDSAKSSAPAVRKLLADPKFAVRVEAEQALKNLEGNSGRTVTQHETPTH